MDGKAVAVETGVEGGDKAVSTVCTASVDTDPWLAGTQATSKKIDSKNDAKKYFFCIIIKLTVVTSTRFFQTAGK
jgi:hypothetical protein